MSECEKGTQRRSNFGYASWIALIIIVFAFFSFWKTYVPKLPHAPWIYHFHGLTITIWLIVLALQPRLVEGRRLFWHRSVGYASIGVFPLMLGGLAGIAVMKAIETPGHAFAERAGPAFAVVDLTSPVLFAWLYYKAVRERRDVSAHAAFAIATMPLLIQPIAARFYAFYVPLLEIRGLQDFYRLSYYLPLTQLPGFLLAVWLRSRSLGHRKLFDGVAIFIASQTVLMEILQGSQTWSDISIELRIIPLLPATLLTTFAGAWLMWKAWVSAVKPTAGGWSAVAPPQWRGPRRQRGGGTRRG